MQWVSHHFLKLFALLLVSLASASYVPVAYSAQPGCTATISKPEDARIGMLVRLVSNQELLVSDHYLLGKHEAIFDWIELNYGKVQKILWSGELEIKSSPGAPDLILRANETSSFAYSKVVKKDPLAPGPKPVLALKGFLDLHPNSRTAATEYIPHHPDYERIDIEFSQHKLADVRHDLRGLASRIFSAILIFENEFGDIPTHMTLEEFVCRELELTPGHFLGELQKLDRTIEYLERRLGRSFNRESVIESASKTLNSKQVNLLQTRLTLNKLKKFMDGFEDYVVAYQLANPPKVLLLSFPR